MIQFTRTRITRGFIRTIGHKLLNGESSVLLGPRFGGKSAVHRMVRDDIVKMFPSVPLLSTAFRAGDGVRSLDDVHWRLHLDGETKESVGLFSAAEKLSVGRESPIILLAANIDQLPTDTAREFLSLVRVRSENRQIIVLLSGSLDFRELVYGPHSEFNCANQYILQFFDEELFSEDVGAYSDKHQLLWKDRAAAIRKLFDLTGGNRHVARSILHIILDNAHHKGANCSELHNLSAIDNILQPDVISGPFWVSLTRRPIDLISGEPDCWGQLQSLVEDGAAPANPGGAPSPLELSGVAIGDGYSLRFVSPFANALIRRHFTQTRIGDLYAQDGQWERAFEHFRRRDLREGPRPTDPEDRLPARATVHALGAAMSVAAKESVAAVNKLFCDGARLILGFQEVTFWEKNDSWRQLEPANEVLSERAPELLRALHDHSERHGLINLPGGTGRFALAAVIASESTKRPRVVLLSSFGTRETISRPRERLSRLLLEAYVSAQETALHSELVRKRLSLRDHHVGILNKLYDSLGGPLFEAGEVLRVTGTELLRLGYRRVMFSLVDPLRNEIASVLELPGDTNLAKATRYSLTGEITDLQQWVVRHAKSRIVPLMAHETFVNSKCHEDKPINAIALVPILDRNNQAVGSILIERIDGSVPSEEEVDDLVLFGRQLARILAQYERVTLLQKALDEGEEPLMIAGPDAKLLYANDPAGELLNLSPGWQSPPIDALESETPIGDAVRRALRDGESSYRQIEAFGSQPYRGEVFVDSLGDWRGQVIGAFVGVHNLEWLMKVVDATEKIGDARSTQEGLEAILNSIASLGFERTRLYELDTATGLLRGRRAVGLDPESLAAYEAGEITLPPRDLIGAQSWRAIDERTPLIFHWQEPGQPERRLTRFGLSLQTLSTARMPTEAAIWPGSYWVELPLYIGDRPYGKIAIDCGDNVRPEAFAAMKLIMQKSATLLAGGEARIAAIKQGFETSMASVAHNLSSRLAALPLVLERYRLEEDLFPELRLINDDFQFIVEHTLKTINRTKEFLSKIVPRKTRFALRPMLERTLQSVFGQEFTLECPVNLTISADAHVIEAAIVELVQNSRQFAKRPETLQVDIRVRELPGVVILEFRDNGPGVPEDIKGQVFDDFFASHPDGSKGTGLGLAFVRRAFESHGGAVRECGTHGAGATFVMELPLVSREG